SAPHGVSQVRLGESKFPEPGSLGLALEVQELTGAHLIAKTQNLNDDANFDEICPYKEKLKRYIKENKIKYLIDFHGLSKKKPIDINLGVNFGVNVKPNEKLFDFLNERLTKKGFVVSIDQPFCGKSGTISGYIAKELEIWTIQVEVNCKYTNEAKYVSYLKDLIDCVVQTIEMSQKM
ncbi:MAG: N-formylglutamate amidohydrolase, partial [Clostridia bacterium]|nr:N-formylglutamate amidohydrolase [Clostridia bacterium]